MNQFKTRQEAELAAQVLTEVLNNPETMFYAEGQTGRDTEFYPVDDHWEVDSTIDFFVALCYWQREQDPRQGGGYGPRPSWAKEAIAIFCEWKKTVGLDEFERVQKKALMLFTDHHVDVANAKRAGYRWSDDIGGWTNEDPNDAY